MSEHKTQNARNAPNTQNNVVDLSTEPPKRTKHTKPVTRTTKKKKVVETPIIVGKKGFVCVVKAGTGMTVDPRVPVIFNRTTVKQLRSKVLNKLDQNSIIHFIFKRQKLFSEHVLTETETRISVLTFPVTFNGFPLVENDARGKLKNFDIQADMIAGDLPSHIWFGADRRWNMNKNELQKCVNLCPIKYNVGFGGSVSYDPQKLATEFEQAPEPSVYHWAILFKRFVASYLLLEYPQYKSTPLHIVPTKTSNMSNDAGSFRAEIPVIHNKLTRLCNRINQTSQFCIRAQEVRNTGLQWSKLVSPTVPKPTLTFVASDRRNNWFLCDEVAFGASVDPKQQHKIPGAGIYKHVLPFEDGFMFAFARQIHVYFLNDSEPTKGCGSVVKYETPNGKIKRARRVIKMDKSSAFSRFSAMSISPCKRIMVATVYSARAAISCWRIASNAREPFAKISSVSNPLHPVLIDRTVLAVIQGRSLGQKLVFVKVPDVDDSVTKIEEQTKRNNQIRQLKAKIKAAEDRASHAQRQEEHAHREYKYWTKLRKDREAHLEDVRKTIEEKLDKILAKKKDGSSEYIHAPPKTI
ncbi:hypothetical protein OAM67_00190 [bacterium]|nr:hypothetical protein [bacterium]